MSDEKRAIRQALREQRKALPVTVVEAAGRAISFRLRGFTPYRRRAAVIAYIANENEIPTDELLADAAAAGRQLYLPQQRNGAVFVRWSLGDALAIGKGGVLEPADCVPSMPPGDAVALIPVVGWDRWGTRLGRGAGIYDRLLAGLPSTIVRIGLAYEFQECRRLPREPWDAPLHYVITERRTVECGAVESLQKGGQQLC